MLAAKFQNGWKIKTGVMDERDCTRIGSKHYNDVIKSTIVSQITSLTIVYSTVYSGADQRKHQSSASLAFVQGIHRGPVNSLHKGSVTRKMFLFDDVILLCFRRVSSIRVCIIGLTLDNLFRKNQAIWNNRRDLLTMNPLKGRSKAFLDRSFNSLRPGAILKLHTQTYSHH